MGHMSLPPGFRFHPTDDELVGYYLKRRADGLPIELEVIPVIDLYKFDPWELPDKSFLPRRDMEWFFFCPRDKKYPNGSRTNRATAAGYWKATGKDRKVFCESSVQGLRKTLVFYRGRAPGGERTDWVMHEYRLCEDLSQPCPNFLGAFALCRVVKRNELVQKVGDSNGESKGKRSLPSAATDFGPRKNSTKAAGISEDDSSSPPASLFEISHDSTPISTVLDQTNIWGSQFFYNDPKESALPTHFLYSTEACPSTNISPVSSYSSFADEFLVDEPNRNGNLSLYPSPLHNMNTYSDLQDMPIQNLEWEIPSFMTPQITGNEGYSTMPYPPICRQASEGADVDLWLQEDSLMVVM